MVALKWSVHEGTEFKHSNYRLSICSLLWGPQIWKTPLQNLSRVCNIDTKMFPPIWTLFSPFCIFLIDFTPLQTGCIGHTIYISRWQGAVAPNSCLLAGIMCRCSCWHLNNVVGFMPVVQCGGLHMNAVDFCPVCRLQFLRISRQSYPLIELAPQVSWILQIRNIPKRGHAFSHRHS